MKKHYLIDFENVSDDGLKGYFELSPEDTVEIFYTENAARIGIEFFENCLAAPERAGLRFIKGPAGKQSLDMQLATYLGALLAGDGAPDAEYCIVSKDKGFASIRQFWQSRRPGAVIRLQRMIRPDGQPQTGPQQKPAEPQNAGQQRPAEPQTSGQTKQPEAQNEAQQKPVGAQTGTQQKPAEPQSAGQQKSTEPQKGAQQKPSEPQSGEQQKKKGGQKPAQQKKSSQKEAEPQNGAGKEEKAADPARARIAAALQKGGIDESVADSVFTLAQSLRGAPAPLRDIYQGIVKKYGQKKGLAIYNLVKSELKQLV